MCKCQGSSAQAKAFLKKKSFNRLRAREGKYLEKLSTALGLLGCWASNILTYFHITWKKTLQGCSQHSWKKTPLGYLQHTQERASNRTGGHQNSISTPERKGDYDIPSITYQCWKTIPPGHRGTSGAAFYQDAPSPSGSTGGVKRHKNWSAEKQECELSLLTTSSSYLPTG